MKARLYGPGYYVCTVTLGGGVWPAYLRLRPSLASGNPERRLFRHEPSADEPGRYEQVMVDSMPLVEADRPAEDGGP